MPDSKREPIWISADRVQKINRRVLKAHERYVLVSENSLGGAIARPQMLYLYEGERDLIVLGVRLLVAIGSNHPFEQGNKRTASQACLVFLERNDVIIDLPDTEKRAREIEAAILDPVQADELVKIFKSIAM